MEEIEISAVVLAPVVIGLVEITKRVGLATRWAAISALVWGVALALVARAAGIEGFSGASWPWSVLLGVISGLVASGLYSGTKAAANRSS